MWIRIVTLADGLLTAAARMFLMLMLAYGIYALMDAEHVSREARLPAALLEVKPEEEPEETAEGTKVLSDELLAVNPDIRGWITVPDTHIDYPVLQGETDFDYLNRDAYGSYSAAGSIYMDSGNAPDFSDGYTLLYGHHMRNGGMFGDVENFLLDDYFASHPEGVLFTRERVEQICFFACLRADAFDEKLYSPELSRGREIGEWLDYIKRLSLQYRECGLDGDERIIGLSTCADSVTNGRILLFGYFKE